METAKEKKKFKLKREYSMVFVLILMLVVCAIISPTFRTPKNIINLFGHNAIYGVISVGMAFIILTGGVDLSAGSICALAGVLSAYAFIDYGFIPGLLAGLGIGILCGLINGLLQTLIGMNHFVATLGMQAMARGAVYIITEGFNIYGTPDEYGVIGMGKIWGLPVAGIIWIVLVAIAAFILKFTKFGRYVYAIGGNENATWLSGVNVKLVKTVVYTLGGMIFGFSGVMLTCRTLLAASNAGLNYEFTAISACVIGGMKLEGGKGNIWGTIIGVLILGLILNIMQLTSISSYWQDFFRGLIIVVAVGIDCVTKMRRE